MLTVRQQRILSIIVGDYIRTTMPIASDGIAQRHDLGVSSATIRNEVAQLEEQGYISRPHTSAGSVPLDKGYRTYVEAIDAASSSAEASAAHTYVRSRLMEAEQDLDNWATVAAQVLARMVGNLGLATFPKAPESKVKYLELVYLQEFLTMLIVVMEQARLRKHLIRLAKPISPTQAEMAGNRVRNQLVGMTGHEIGQLDGADLSPLEEEMVEATALILDEEDDRAVQRPLPGRPAEPAGAARVRVRRQVTRRGQRRRRRQPRGGDTRRDARGEHRARRHRAGT